MPSLRAVVGMASTLVAASALAGPPSKLIVVHSTWDGSTKLTYGSTDAAAGIDQGSNTGSISAIVDVHVDSASKQLLFPAGSSRWIRNTESSAKYTNRGVASYGFDIVDGKRLKVTGDGFDLVGATTTITVAITIDDGGEVSTHCVRFEPSECEYKTATRREKVTCKGGSPDPTCGVPPTTTTTSTAPPPSTTSTSLVYAQAPDCCQGSGECRNGPSTTFLSTLNSFCQNVLPGSISKPGNVCGDDGQCRVYQLPEPKNLCCERSADCYGNGGPAGLGDTVWFFRNTCYGNGGLAYQDAVCGVSGNCAAD